MTRRKTLKRPRLSAHVLLGVLRKSALELVPTELWHIVLSFCWPTTLLVARAVCRLFRHLIDARGGELLARAPLLLPHPPPDPRFMMRETKRDEEYTTLRDLLEITDPHEPRSYGSAKYTKLLFQPGACYICDSRTPGPPECLEPNIYLCSRPCEATFFRKKLRFLQAKLNYRFPHSPCPEIDRYIIPWLPLFTMNRLPRDEKAHGVLISDLEKARKEYSDVLALPEGREERERALFAEYARRYQRHRALLQFQMYVDEWRLEWEKDVKEAARENDRRIRSIAQKADACPAEARNHPAIREIVSTRTRDLRRVTPSTLKPKRVGLGKSSAKQICSICTALVSASWMERHLANFHPNQLVHTRVSPTAGKTEYRCELCPAARVRWFTEKGLTSHKFKSHGVRPRESHRRGLRLRASS